MTVMAELLHRWWGLISQPPPPPPQELLDAKRELREAVVHARLAAREQRRMIDRLGEVIQLARDGDEK